jgi:hypothetical protein
VIILKCLSSQQEVWGGETGVGNNKSQAISWLPRMSRSEGRMAAGMLAHGVNSSAPVRRSQAEAGEYALAPRQRQQ